ncbi:MAG: CvpA family protein [Clostridia bacterium]|nr:CvpA family protein [Clostridia bacterium]
MKKATFKTHLFCALGTLVFGAVNFYFTLPALNIHAGSLLGFIISLCICYGILFLIQTARQKITQVKTVEIKALGKIPDTIKVLLGIVALCIAVGLIGSLAGAQIFNAKRYRELLTVEEGNFTEDVSQITYNNIPRLDSASAMRLGDRKMGELSDMVSQFDVMDNYTQINYQGRPVRVTPLAYVDVFKWLSNVKDGVPGYLMIDMVTQEVELIRLEDGMKYSTAEHFGRNLARHLRFQYPTKIFADQTFEVDESGTPYWICPTYEFTIGLYGGRDINGAVLVNAVTGDSTYYNVADIPSWVDRVYNADLIIEQYDYYGTLINGFWNSVFAQKDCRVTTDGYNYMAQGDDVYMYTGVTSMAADESNIGFILCNQRTKETKFYAVPGAEEYSAMNSAQGQVQEMRYTSTFPLLLNIANEPTYFVALKDASELVKMYAMVNVRQYQIVVAADTVEECEQLYVEKLYENRILEEVPEDISGQTAVTGAITSIRSAVVDGNTCFYYQLDSIAGTFALSVATDQRAVTLNVGDTVTFTYDTKKTDEIITVLKLEK